VTPVAVPLYVGIDHSLTGFGAAAVSANWGGNWARVRRITLASDAGCDAMRRGSLLRDLVRWLRWVEEAERQPYRRMKVAIEGGIFMRGKAKTIRSQERLAGVVEHELYHRLSVQVETLEQTAVRTTFAGSSLARGRGAGDAMQALMRQLVGNEWDEAELDAFLVLNQLLALNGEYFVSCAPSATPNKRGRRAA
jgi:hypothetical protein